MAKTANKPTSFKDKLIRLMKAHSFVLERGTEYNGLEEACGTSYWFRNRKTGEVYDVEDLMDG